jgi:hypothetical protein
MSQRGKAGFNPPRFSVSARDEFKSSPAIEAWRGSWSSLRRIVPSGFIAVVDIPDESFQSRALGVAHPDTLATS